MRERRIVGGSHLKLRLSPVEGGPVVDAIAFGGADHGWDDLDGAVRAAYRLDVNAYRGRERLQLVVVHMEPA
ncbi:Single-stranded-DNA-specific exonuclease RecJ [wastewater metagenome]|uniref:Single-stranded-DNA-specific exonuclease RecJ n=2 Tax=unclassified sequences TaxID=12908 RepID=A0A5B8RA19_9ZZZZ|nr:single-stranded-DNA-specific exonuclease RecJ [uncultured organism]